MKNYIIVLAIFAVFQFPVFAQDQAVGKTAMSFFDATKSGDVDLIMTMIDAPLLEQIRVLLTRNKNYAAYLRQHYDNATAEIHNVSEVSNGEFLVDLTVTFEDNAQVLIRMRMLQIQSGDWKIVEQKQVY